MCAAMNPFDHRTAILERIVATPKPKRCKGCGYLHDVYRSKCLYCDRPQDE